VVSVSIYEAADPGSILGGTIFSRVAAQSTPSALKAVAAIAALFNAGCEFQLKLYF